MDFLWFNYKPFTMQQLKHEAEHEVIMWFVPEESKDEDEDAIMEVNNDFENQEPEVEEVEEDEEPEDVDAIMEAYDDFQRELNSQYDWEEVAQDPEEEQRMALARITDTLVGLQRQVIEQMDRVQKRETEEQFMKSQLQYISYMMEVNVKSQIKTQAMHCLGLAQGDITKARHIARKLGLPINVDKELI